MRANDQMKEFVVGLLKAKLPKEYYYHNHKHTLYVLDRALEIGKAQGATGHELNLLYASGLWHDVGYINIYTGHEKESCVLAKQYLPDFHYPPAEIEVICGMIMATLMPQRPHTALEQVLADADLEYLGSSNAEQFAGELFAELQALNPSFTEEQWKADQISFIRKHRYFTDYCRHNKEPLKQEYLRHLQGLGS